ncbi:MAG: cation transporter, partial [Oscillospiraceae bacterium]
ITLGLSANSIQLMLTGGNVVDGKQISYFQLALGVLSIIVYTFMKRIGKKIVSPTIQTELYGWKIDIYYSCGMSAAFFASTLLEGTVFDPILPYFDQVVAIVIVISVLPDLLKMIFSAIRDIFLFAPEQEILDKIKEVSDNIMKKYSYDMVFLDVTRTGRKIWIGVYINPNETNIAVLTLKEATKRLNTELNKDFGDCEAVIIVDAL